MPNTKNPPTPPTLAGERILTPQQLTEIFPGTTVQSWAARRAEKKSPPYIRLGIRVYYVERLVWEWIQSKSLAGEAVV